MPTPPDAAPYRRVLSVHGVPRSGTSWLGQVFNSHPDVAFRYQPLFSYGHKGALRADSSAAEIRAFFQAIYSSEDELVMQRGRGRLGSVPAFAVKHARPTTLIWKEVRYHYVLSRLFEIVPDYRAVGLIRHPCAVINSFLRTPREWRPEWSPEAEWRDAPRKNQGRAEEYFGFTRWKEAAGLFLDLAARYPGRFVVVRYEDLVADPMPLVETLFALAGLQVHEQTVRFLAESQAGEDRDHDHGVFKNPGVVSRWIEELPEAIAGEIRADLRGGSLERFLAA